MLNSESDFTISDGVLKFKDEHRSFPAPLWVEGEPIHSHRKDKKSALRRRKECVACAVKADRGGAPWDRTHLYAITLEFRFRRRPHSSQEGDVDNYVKGVLDALAAGLFLPESEDPCDLPETWAMKDGVDDSNFRILLIRRLPNAETPEEEGVRLFVSTTGRPAENDAAEGSSAEDCR